jgi:hypothetical protein
MGINPMQVYKGDPDNWAKMTKNFKITFLRTAVKDSSPGEQKPEHRIRESLRTTGLQIAEPILASVDRLKAIWQRELERREQTRTRPGALEQKIEELEQVVK